MVPHELTHQGVTAVDGIACTHRCAPADIGELRDRVQRCGEIDGKIGVEFAILTEITLTIKLAQAHDRDRDYLDNWFYPKSHCRLLNNQRANCIPLRRAKFGL